MKPRVARDPHFDVVVLGDGPGGSAAAAESARHGLRTALVGRDAGQRSNIGECLPPGIRPELEKAGVWEEFLLDGHTPSAGIRSVWGSPEPSDRDFLFSPYGAGWHIQRARFDAMMRRSATRCGAEALGCRALRGVTRTSEGWQLDLVTEEGGCQVTGSRVIDATGRASVFARRIGVRRRLLDSLTGVAAHFAIGEMLAPIEPVLLVEAVENGWWYTAPLPDGERIAVFLTDAAYIQRAGLTQPDRWLALLETTVLWGSLPPARGFSPALRILPAESSFLEQIAGDGWLAAGDAAAAFDPLSSQGITSAISSGLAAGRTAAGWLEGDTQASAMYAASARRKYAEYLAHREVYYRIERRWPNSSFWKSRHAPPRALATNRKVVSA
ncbi:MAG TPA: tryptophan 7-halogenase [Bryobacteraceae bacterium]|nr:tryptophan 7-halogenase [Bryobacteraceae bacterium]